MRYDKPPQLSCCHANRPAIGGKVKLRVIVGHRGQIMIKEHQINSEQLCFCCNTGGNDERI